MYIFWIYMICNLIGSSYNVFKLIFNKIIMTNIDVEAFRKEGFTFEEIESVKRGLDDVENWRTYTEEEFYSRLEKRLFSNDKVNV